MCVCSGEGCGEAVCWKDRAEGNPTFYAGFFEFHVTVEGADVGEFRAACEELRVKPVLLDLQLRGGGVQKELMTSSTEHWRGSVAAIRRVRALADAFRSRGFDVVREKVETVPWSAEAPSVLSGVRFGPGQYFETHVAAFIEPGREGALREVGERHGARTSRNVFKSEAGGAQVMSTIRSYDLPYELHTDAVVKFERDLAAAGLPVRKVRSEFAIFDSRPHHDAAWIGRAA